MKAARCRIPTSIAIAAVVLTAAIVLRVLGEEAWALPLAVGALCTFLVEDGVRLAWAGLVACLGATIAFAAGLEGLYDVLALGAVGLWLVAFVASWPPPRDRRRARV